MIRSRRLNIGIPLLSLYTVSVINLSYQDGLTVFSKIFALALVALYLLRILQKRTTLAFPLEFRFLFAWFLWAILATIFATNFNLAFSKLVTVTQVLILSIAIYSTVVEHKTSAPFWIALIAGALIACVITLQNPDKFIGWDGRISGPVGNANLFGFVLITAMTASLAFTFTVKRFAIKTIFLAISIFLFYMISETGSRKAMIGSVLVLVTVSAVILNDIRRGSTAKFVLGSIVGLTLILGGIVYIASSEHVSRIENAVSAARAGDISQADSSLEHRKNFIVLAAKQTAQHPILGVGLDNFRDIGVGFFRSIGTYSHSNYMEVMVSTGIPGLLLYCAMYVTVIVKCFAARTYYLGGDRVRLFAICAAIVLIVVVFDFAMVSYYEKPIWLLLAVIFGQLELLRRNPDSLTSNQI